MLINSDSYKLIDSSKESNQTAPKLGGWKDSQEFTSLVVKFANNIFNQFLTKWKQRVDNTGLKTHYSVYPIPGEKKAYKPAKKVSEKYRQYYFKKILNECEKVLFPGTSKLHLSPKEIEEHNSKFYHDLAKQISYRLKLKFKERKERIGKEFEYDVTLFNPKTKDKCCPHIKITAKLVPGKFRSLGFLSDLVFSNQKDEESS